MLFLESARPARATAGCGMIVTASARMGCARIGDVRAVSGHAISDQKTIHVYHHEDVVECVGMYIWVDRFPRIPIPQIVYVRTYVIMRIQLNM